MKSPLITISFILFCVNFSTQETCQFENANGRLDLSSVSVTAESLVPLNTNSTVYFFHPCTDTKTLPRNFSEALTKPCLDATGFSLCKMTVTVTNETTYSFEKIGVANDGIFSEKNGIVYISYKDEKEPPIALVCTTKEDESVLALQGSNLFYYSPQACFHELPHEGHSVGAILLLILAIVMLIYFVGGYFFKYFMFGFRGEEAFPHLDFWRSLPGLVTDGFNYLRRGRQTVPAADSYETI